MGRCNYLIKLLPLLFLYIYGCNNKEETIRDNMDVTDSLKGKLNSVDSTVIRLHAFLRKPIDFQEQKKKYYNAVWRSGFGQWANKKYHYHQPDCKGYYYQYYFDSLKERDSTFSICEQCITLTVYKFNGQQASFNDTTEIFIAYETRGGIELDVKGGKLLGYSHHELKERFGEENLKRGNVLIYHDNYNTVAKFNLQDGQVGSYKVARYDVDLQKDSIPEVL